MFLLKWMKRSDGGGGLYPPQTTQYNGHVARVEYARRRAI